MNRKSRRTKSPYQLKDEQVNFLLEDIENNLEEYKKNSRNKRQTAIRSKKNTARGKNSNETLTKEKKQLKEYIAKIKQQYKQQQQQEHYFLQEQESFRPKRYKKVVYEEATNSEPEIEEENTPTEKIVE